jgi:putative chitinase
MSLSNEGAFFTELRRGLMSPSLSTQEVQGCHAILTAGEGLPITHVAYMFATAFHETAHTLQPVKEANWLTDQQAAAYFHRMYDKGGARPDVAARLGNTEYGDGVKFAGRGYVQLTGRTNYARAEKELGLPFTTSPDLMLLQGPAALVMRRGMVEGWFTSRKLADYLPAVGYMAARRIINGQDKAADIAAYATRFEEALRAGGWSS